MTERILNDRYALESKVGEGGMAVTYRARDLLLNRIVAIKLMREQFTSDPKFIERFRNEAQAAARISHENIANVYDTGKANGTYYIVMEFVEGTDLKQRLRRDGPLPVLTVLEFGRQTAAALEAAHAKSLVHRDIKPHNILLDCEGKVKVTDFGIAKVVSESEDTGVIIGSVHYLSPEQARGDATTPASDIYALGCVLFELLTGRTVFEGENSMAVAHKQIYEPAPHPRSLRPEIPPPVEALILRCLQKDPAARFQTAAEVKNTLAQLINHLAQEETVVIPAPPASDSTIVYRKPLNNTPPQRPRTNGAKEKPLEVTLDNEVEVRGGARGWVIAIVFVALAAVVAYGAFWWIGKNPDWHRRQSHQPQKIAVPSLLGLSEDNAKSLLATRKLIAQRGKDEPSAEYARGLICGQSPAAGEQVDHNTPIFYFVSAGSETFTMPDVGLMSITVAKTNIRAAAEDTDPKKPLLDFVTTKEPSDTVPKGFVIRTLPAVNEQTARTRRTKVTLVISTGPEQKVNEYVKQDYNPGKAMSLTRDDHTVYIKIELENPAGSDPQTLLIQTFNTGDDIPVQHFDRLSTDTAVVHMYAARDENSPLQEIDTQIFAPAPGAGAPAPPAAPPATPPQ